MLIAQFTGIPKVKCIMEFQFFIPTNQITEVGVSRDARY